MQNGSGRFGQGNAEHLTIARLVGLQGRLAHASWRWMGGWAAWCGALASNQLRWDAQILLTLALVVILADLAWGSVWDLATGPIGRQLRGEGWIPPQSGLPTGLPYMLPEAPAGRLSLQVQWLVAWWRQVFWPAAGSALLGLLVAVLLTVVLAILLPDRLRLLHAALVALVGLGVVQRRRGWEPLAGQALVQVGLSWWAGHLVFGELNRASFALALIFSLATLGALRVAQGRRSGLWFLNGSLIVGTLLVVGWRQPLIAGVMGLLFFGAAALQLTLNPDREIEWVKLFDRTGPWLMAIMLMAALAVP
jgi:hypothetical protein